MPKRVLAKSLLLFFLFLSLGTGFFAATTTPVYAQANPTDHPASVDNAVNQSVGLKDCGPIDIPCHLGNSVKWLVSGIMRFVFSLLGVNTEATIKYQAYYNGDPHAFDNLVNQNALLPGSIILLSKVSPTSNDAISLKGYLATINPLTAPTAQASGTDELAQVRFIINLWRYFLNMAYVMMVVVIVAIGFLIMFRFNIDPRTVVSVENSIPRIIVALVLMTFSFAFAGLILDLSRIVALMFFPDRSFFGVGQVSDITIIAAFTAVVGGMIGLAFASGPAMPFIALGIVLAGFYILTLIFNILYQIMYRYAQFILMTILAPLIFALSAVPNFSSLASGWFKRQVALLLSIAGIFFLVNIAFSIIGSGTPSALPSPIASIPGKGVGVIDFLIHIVFNNIVIGIGLLFYATKVPAIVDELLGIKELGARSGIGMGGILAGVTGERGLSKGLSAAKTMAKQGGSFLRNTGAIAMSGVDPATGARVNRFKALGRGLSSTFGATTPKEKTANIRRLAAAVRGYGGEGYDDYLNDQLGPDDRQKAISAAEGLMKSNGGNLRKALDEAARLYGGNGKKYADLRSGEATQLADAQSRAAVTLAVPTVSSTPLGYTMPAFPAGVVPPANYNNNLIKLARIVNKGNPNADTTPTAKELDYAHNLYVNTHKGDFTRAKDEAIRVYAQRQIANRGRTF